MLLVDNFTNKQLWLDIYKKENDGKMEQAYIHFFNTLMEIFQSEDTSYDEAETIEFINILLFSFTFE